MKPVILLLTSLVLHAMALGAGENPERTWTNNAGKSFIGRYQHGDGFKVWIKVGSAREFAVEMVDLTPADRAAVKALQGDFSWRLRSVKWPGTLSAPATRPAFRDSTASKNGLHVFRTRSFEFKVDEDLSPQVVGEFGRTFEATSELFAHLPWDVRPAPPGGRFYQARLFSDRPDFLVATGVEDRGNAKIAGLYKPGDRVIYVPLESLSKDNQAANGTLRHELVHQMMHDMLPVIPWWVAEGTAEYVRIIPWDGRGAYECAGAGSVQVMRRIAAEGAMNREAFTSLFQDECPEFPEAQTARQCEAAREQAMAFLLGIRKERADLVAGKKKPLPPGGTQPPAPISSEPLRIPVPSSISDTGLLTVLKYHAAKLFVYYLQHLESDGKGTKMLQLMWHLRQWADETNAQRPRFEEQTKQFRAQFKEFESRVKDFGKMETAYHAALLKRARNEPGLPPDPPQPIAPEEELMRMLPNTPDPGVLAASAQLARWTDIKKKSIGESPAGYYAEIIAAFHARRIDLPVR